MSLTNKKNVPQLVEKYRQKYPQLDRDLLRKLIRIENKIENASELKKLDRDLAKAFKNEVALSSKEKPSTEVKPSKLGLFGYWNKRAERNKEEKEKQRKEVWAQYYTYCDLVAKFYPEMQALKDWADIEKKHRKELGLE